MVTTDKNGYYRIPLVIVGKSNYGWYVEDEEGEEEYNEILG